jgi:hypothetical protein
MSPDEMMKWLRERADELGYAYAEERQMLREAADMVGRMAVALNEIALTFDPKHKPPDRKWAMDRAFEVARRALR